MTPSVGWPAYHSAVRCADGVGVLSLIITTRIRPMSRHTLAGLLIALTAGVATPVFAQQVTMETLLDRIQIEDLLVRYYYDLTMGRAHEMSEYFAEDALLDVDGTIANGRAEIE